MKLIVLLLFLIAATAIEVVPVSLPLRIQAITPPIAGDHSTLIELDQPIQVIFNRAVIPLGLFAPELPPQYIPFTFSRTIPGKFRWVTTSIARFDPDNSWKSDLEFTLSINSNLTAYDGTKIELTNSGNYDFVTPPLSAFIEEIISNKTSNLTGDAWHATIGNYINGVFVSESEVPPDGEIFIRFNNDVDMNMLRSAFQLSNTRTGESAQFELRRCSDSDNRCIVVMPTGLSVDTRYTLLFPKGSYYNDFSGALSQAISFDFYGLFSFSFPFLKISDVKSQSFDLLLRHGLSEDNFAKLPSNIKVPGIDLQFDMPKPYILRISGNFRENSQYELQVIGNESITDGWNLPLQSGELTISTGPSQPFLLQASGQFIRFDTFKQNWTIIAQSVNSYCTENPIIEFYQITKNNLKEAIAGFLSYDYRLPGPTQKLSVTVTTKEDELATYSIPTNTLLDNGLFLLKQVNSDYRCNYLVGTSFIMTTKFYVTLTVGYRRLYGWVIDSATSALVPNASVKIYSVINYNPTPSSVLLAYSATTNSNGQFNISYVNSDFDYKRYFAVVEYQNSLSILEISSPQPVEEPSYVSSLVTDRTIYKDSETVYVQGYVRSYFQSEVSVPTGKFHLQVYWKNDQSADAMTDLPVTVESTFGTFFTNFTVPKTADYGMKNLNLMFTTASGTEYSIGYSSFVISDPRIPLAQVLLSSEAKFLNPTKPLPIKVTLQTYTGVPLIHEKVQLKWTLNRGYWSNSIGDFLNYGEDVVTGLNWISPIIINPPAQLASETGMLELSSDHLGIIETTLNLTFQQEPLEGDSLEILVSYIDPTRASIEESLVFPVGYAERTLSVRLTTLNPLPGMHYGVFANLQEFGSGDPVIGEQVIFDLYEYDGRVLPKDITEWDMTSLATCTFESDMGNTFKCDFVMDIKKYLLVGKTVDLSGNIVATAVVIGKSPEEWNSHPVYQVSEPFVTVDRQMYSQNDEVKINFLSHFSDGNVIVLWGTKYMKSSKTFKLATGNQTLSIQLGQECLESCQAKVIIVAAENAFTLPPSLPTSKLFDTKTLRSFVSDLMIPIEKTAQINIGLDVSPKVASPNETVQISVHCTDEQGQPVEANVLIYVVDKAILDLSDLPNGDPNQLLLRSYEYIQTFDNLPWAIESGYNASLVTFLRRIQKNPFIIPYWEVYPNFNSEVDMSDEDYFSQDRLSTWITLSFPMTYYYRDYFGDAKNGGGAVPEGAPTVNDDNSVNGVTATTIPSQFIRSNFVRTPLAVSMKIPKEGKNISFNLPDNLSTFVVKAYAAAKDLKTFSSTETEIVSKRLFSTATSLPRIVRTGDVFLGGVSVTLTEEDNLSDDISVSVEILCGSIALNDSNTHDSSVEYGNPKEVLFKFVAVGTGISKLKFSVMKTGILQDALITELPVFGPQEPVTVATSFAIDASKASPWSEGLVLPDAIPNSGSVNFQAGIGRFPVVVSYSNSLIYYDKIYPNGMDIVSSMMPSVILPIYDLPSWSFLSEVTAAKATSLDLLSQYTDPVYGLQYYPDHQNPFVSPWLNIHGLFVAKILAQHHDTSLSSLQKLWSNALQTWLVNAAQAQKTDGMNFTSWDILSYSFYVLGTDWTPNTDDAAVLTILSLKNLRSHYKDVSLEAKAILSLSLKTIDEWYIKTLNELNSNIRITGRTAYIGYQKTASVDVTTTMLYLILQTSSKQIIAPQYPIDKIANFVSAQKENQKYYGFNSVWFSPQQLCYAIMGLTYYDKLKGNNAPNVNFSIRAGDLEILRKYFTSVADSPVNASLSFEMIRKGADEVNFYAKGKGEISAIASMTFVPSEIPTTPIYQGISVNRVIQEIDFLTDEVKGGPIHSAAPGTKVRVTIEMTTPDYIAQVRVVEPLAGGLEAIDRPQPYMIFDNFYRPWFWSYFQQQVRPSSIEWFSSSLYPGTHTVTYDALIVTSGNFTLPPTKVYSVLQPELMGLSAGGFFETIDSDFAPLVKNITGIQLFESCVDTIKVCEPRCSESQVCALGNLTCVDNALRVNDQTMEEKSFAGWKIFLIVLMSLVFFGLVGFLVYALRKSSRKYFFKLPEA
jgi:hypothetical protein